MNVNRVIKDLTCRIEDLEEYIKQLERRIYNVEQRSIDTGGLSIEEWLNSRFKVRPFKIGESRELRLFDINRSDFDEWDDYLQQNVGVVMFDVGLPPLGYGYLSFRGSDYHQSDNFVGYTRGVGGITWEPIGTVSELPKLQSEPFKYRKFSFKGENIVRDRLVGNLHQQFVTLARGYDRAKCAKVERVGDNEWALVKLFPATNLILTNNNIGDSEVELTVFRHAIRGKILFLKDTRFFEMRMVHPDTYIDRRVDNASMDELLVKYTGNGLDREFATERHAFISSDIGGIIVVSTKTHSVFIVREEATIIEEDFINKFNSLSRERRVRKILGDVV